MKFRVFMPLVLLGILTVGACATGGPRRERPDPDLITRQELLSIEVTNLWDAINRLRPRWLTADRRAGERSFGNVAAGVVVYQGQTYLGSPDDVLPQWSPTAVYSIEWLDGSTASASLPGLGSRHVLGAIILHTSPNTP